MAGSMMLVLAVAITMCVITSEAYPRRPGLAYCKWLNTSQPPLAWGAGGRGGSEAVVLQLSLYYIHKHTHTHVHTDQQLDHFYCTGLPQSMLENGVDGGCCTAKRKCQVIVPNGPDCWCDSLCYTYNDCCDDIDEIDCPEPPSPTPSQPTPAPIGEWKTMNLLTRIPVLF